MTKNGCTAIDLLSEDLIDPRRACAEPVLRNARTGKPSHISRVYRYFMHGARAANGERVRLETILTHPGGGHRAKQSRDSFRR